MWHVVSADSRGHHYYAKVGGGRLGVHGAYFPEILRSLKRSHDESAEADDDPGQFRRVRLRCWSWQATLSEASDNDKSIEAQPVSHATWSTGQLEAGAPHRPRTEFGEIAPISFANTYWTVEKQQECLNLIKSLGTDWHPIANTMKDTTPLMVDCVLPPTYTSSD